jgi:centractin
MEPGLDNLMFNKQPIVIDNGSGLIKAGLSGDERPKLIFNNYVGRPKHNKVMLTTHDQDLFIGPECDKNKGLLKLSYPMQHGSVDNWEDMEQIWGYIFKEMKVSPSQHPILLSEPIENPMKNREKAAELFFENMSVPAMYFQTQPILSLYAQGKTTGFVLDCGDGVTQCVPIVEGFAIKGASNRMDIGGRDVTEYLSLLLRRAGYNFHTSSEFQIVKNIKEKLANLWIVPLKEADYKDSGNKNNQIDYCLPDGSDIIIKTEHIEAPEILFTPQKIGLEYPGIHEMVYNCIMKCDVDLRSTIFSNLIVAGGTTALKKFSERLHKSITKLAPKDVKIKLIAPKNR